MKLLCAALLVFMGHQALAKPKGKERSPANVTTRMPLVIEPIYENDPILGKQTLLNPNTMPVKNIKDCKAGEFQCDIDLCVSEVKRCDGRINCLDESDENDCKQVDIPKVIKKSVYHQKQVDIPKVIKKSVYRQSCGRVISEKRGSFNYPNDGGEYQNDQDCEWTIRAGHPIKITFTRFQVETNYDWLKIRDGDNSGSTLLGEYTGHTIPISIETSGNEAFIQFTSDYSVTFPGFEIRWESLGCGGEYTTSNGLIKHPLNDDEYGNTEICIWKIKTTEPIMITFVSFDLESDYDFLYVRDGEYSESSLLGSFTGDILPSTVQTSQNSALINFASDYSVTDKGFEICWEPASNGGTACQCGLANRERIVGGTEVNPKRKYPWQIGLFKPSIWSKKWIFCGGTIINNRWILTAAHCITDQATCKPRYDSSSNFKVWVGEHNQFDENDDISDTKKYGVKSYIRHPDYSCKTLNYDFALLELTETIPFNSVIRPICLPEDDRKTYAGRTATITGWGNITNSGPKSDFLREVQVGEILANKNCGVWHNLATMKICSGGQSGGPCLGDSGGPMFLFENNKPVQIGVVSYHGSRGCGSTEQPSVLARVSSALPWITETTNRKCSCRDSCRTKFTSTSGKMTSSNYPEEYEHNEDCAWVISAPEGTKIVLSFMAFELEKGYDYLYIRDGNSASSNLLHTLPDDEHYADVVSSGNHLHISFTSDGSVAKSGFYISWEFERPTPNDIVIRYAPKLRFDSKFGTSNKCFPSSAASYYNTRASGNNNRICNTDYNTMNNGNVPTYWRAMECGDDRARDLHIAYWFFSGYQDTCFWGTGSHNSDWEHVVVKVVNYKSSNRYLGSVQFYQHSGWYTKNPGEYDTDATHPIVYSGKNSHSSYHDDGGSGGCCYWEDFRNPGSSNKYLRTWLNLEELRRTDSAPAFMQDLSSQDKFEMTSPLERPETYEMCKLPGCKGTTWQTCNTSGCFKSQVGSDENF